MCQIMEELNEMAVNHAREETAVSLLKYGDSVEKIVAITKLPESRILELQKELELEM